jgi:hypothetical protein
MDQLVVTRAARSERAERAAARGRRRAAGEAGDAGMATAELAVALPGLALVVGLLLWSIQLAGVHLACGAAAREAARALARGESPASMADRVGALPKGARLVVQERPESWQVSVRLPVRGGQGLAALLPPMEIRGEAVAAKEPSAEALPW